MQRFSTPARPQENTRNVLSNGGGVSALTSLIMVLGVVTHLTDHMVADTVQRTMFNRYLIGQSVGVPALVLGQQLFSFLSLENQTKRTTIASVICFGANAAADALFTVVIPLGTLGLGLASSISVWLFFGYQALYYLSGKSHLRFSVRLSDGQPGKAFHRYPCHSP